MPPKTPPLSHRRPPIFSSGGIFDLKVELSTGGEPTAMSDEVGPNAPDPRPIRRPPARTSTRRTRQLVVQAQDLLEERIQAKTASPTELVAAIRLGTETELANIERIKAQTELLKAQKAKSEAETVSGQMFKDAMDAIVRYQGGRSREPGD